MNFDDLLFKIRSFVNLGIRSTVLYTYNKTDLIWANPSLNLQ